MSAVAHAMKVAGFDASAALLNQLAVAWLKRFDLKPHLAATSFAKEICEDGGMLMSLMGERLSYAIVRGVALEYLERLAANMRGESLLRGGQSEFDTHPKYATPKQSNEDDVGHRCVAPQAGGTVPASSSPKADGEGRDFTAGQATTVVPSPSAPVRGEELQPFGDPQRFFAPAPKPNPPRGLSAIRSVQASVAKSLLDTFTVRDGRAIGDLQWHELTKLARTNESEARVLRYVADHVANAPSHAKVRDIVKVTVIEAAVKHAEAINATV